MELAGPTADKDESTGKVASIDQIRRALVSLTSDEKEKLSLIARSWLRRYQLDRAKFLPSDLVNEVILRTLDGRRKWPFEAVSFMYYLDRTMGSIARHEYDELNKFTAIDPDYSDPAPKAGSTDFDEPYPELAALEAAFADDQEIWQYLLLKNEGKTVAQVAEAMGKNTREIEAIKKRANRRIVKLSGSVGKHGEQ